MFLAICKASDVQLLFWLLQAGGSVSAALCPGLLWGMKSTVKPRPPFHMESTAYISREAAKCISVSKRLLSRWYLICLWKAQGKKLCHQLTGFSWSVSTWEAKKRQEYGWGLKGHNSCSSFWSTEGRMHTVNACIHIYMCVCLCRIPSFQFLICESLNTRP